MDLLHFYTNLNLSEHEQLAHSRPSKLLRFTNVVAFTVLIVVTVIAAGGRLPDARGHTIRHFHSPLTPAGWTFFIWALIYGLQGAGVVYQVIGWGYSNDGWKTRAVNSIGVYWQLSWYFEIVFQILFCIEKSAYLIPAFFVLIAEVVCYSIAFHRLYLMCAITRGIVSMTRRSYTVYFAPTVISLAWLSVMTAIAALAVVVSFGVDEDTKGLQIAGLVFGIVLIVVGLAVEYRCRDILFCLTLSWAYIGIYIENRDKKIPGILALVCFVLSIIMAISSLVRKLYRHQAGAAALMGMGRNVAQQFQSFVYMMKEPQRDDTYEPFVIPRASTEA